MTHTPIRLSDLDLTQAIKESYEAAERAIDDFIASNAGVIIRLYDNCQVEIRDAFEGERNIDIESLTQQYMEVPVNPFRELRDCAQRQTERTLAKINERQRQIKKEIERNAE